MHLSLKARRFLPTVLSVALLLSTASAGVGYAENSAGQYNISGGKFIGDRRLTVSDTEINLYCLEHKKTIPNYTHKDDQGNTINATVYKSGDLGLSDEVKRLLMIALYAGYPNNGYSIYDVKKIGTIDINTFNSYLKVPASFLTDEYTRDLLGNETYSYEDFKTNNLDHYKRLEAFVLQVPVWNRTTSGLSKIEVESSAFYTAAYQMVQAHWQSKDPIEEWNKNIKDSGGADYIAFQATQNAIWKILQENNVPNNDKTVSFNELGEEIYAEVIRKNQEYTNTDPDTLKIKAPSSVVLTFNAEKNQWETEAFKITDNAQTSEKYNISIDDSNLQLMTLNGDKWESAGNSIESGQPIRLISKDNISSEATMMVDKEVSWIDGDGLKQFTPVDEKDKQTMIGAMVGGNGFVHSKRISVNLNVIPGKATPSDMPASSSDIKKETPSNIVETSSDVPTTPDEPEKPRHRGGSGGGSGYSGATGIKSVFSTPEASTSEVAPETTPAENEAVPSDPEGAVKGQHRDRLHDGNATDGETAGASRSVQTGDHAHMILYLAVSLIALIGLLGWKRKAEKQG